MNAATPQTSRPEFTPGAVPSPEQKRRPGAGLFFLLSLVVTKYTIVGLKRYIEMNFSLLKGH